MSTQGNVENASNAAIQKRIDMDLLRRSKLGLLIYPIILPVILIPHGYHKLYPLLSWWLIGAMLVLCVLRFMHLRASTVLHNYSSRLWKVLFSTLTLLQACVLSIFFAIALFNQDFSPITQNIALMVAGFSGAAAVSLSPSLRLAIAYICILLIPATIASAYTHQNLSYTITMAIYLLYLSLLSHSTHKEYMKAFAIELDLEEKQLALQKLSRVDSLTNVYNRGYFDSLYKIQHRTAIRAQREQSLLMLDVDHFKLINDNYGHLFGDKCLIEIANILKQATQRETDLVSRFGGEEFIVLLHNTPGNEALKMAEKIRVLVQDYAFTYNENSVKITASIGVASMIPQVGEQEETLLNFADKALYQAKHNGRNRVVAYKSEKTI